MAYTMQESRDAFEVIRRKLLETPSGIDIATLVADSDLTAIIADEQERYDFIAKKPGGAWVMDDEVIVTTEVALSGAAAGDGDVVVTIGPWTYTSTPTAGDSEITVATELALAINTDGYAKANTAGNNIYVYDTDGMTVGASSTDTGMTVSTAYPILFGGGTVHANGRGVTFAGTASKS